jgi:hypothetical protein
LKARLSLPLETPPHLLVPQSILLRSIDGEQVDRPPAFGAQAMTPGTRTVVFSHPWKRGPDFTVTFEVQRERTYRIGYQTVWNGSLRVWIEDATAKDLVAWAAPVSDPEGTTPPLPPPPSQNDDTVLPIPRAALPCAPQPASHAMALAGPQDEPSPRPTTFPGRDADRADTAPDDAFAEVGW